MNLYDLVKPALFALPAETAHRLGHAVLEYGQETRFVDPVADRLTVTDPRLEVEAFDQTFPNPVGVAAGFDKNAEIPPALATLGFGHVEVGGVTAERQPGNPRPRMFRLREDRAVVNRMGFNNHGADTIGPRLADTDVEIPVGVNIGKSKSTPLAEAADDYRYSFERTRAGGDYFVVNVSSPNTPGLRELQDREPLERILSTLQDAGASPLLLKLSPDLGPEAIESALDVVNELGLDGVVATNTSVRRPASLESPKSVQEGGLSGAPIEAEATEMIRFVAERTDVPIVGVGGVADADGAYDKIRAGASVVQLYTALVYEGPTVARDINRGLLDLLERDGFGSVEDAVGADLA
ncbi:quinone-dependent dihydroorotate dehydrogenase [Halosegnis rubeus]|uniref:Dihydroorotate dehydrogenase (quinone) n=1 Tax=Halosegnis rubeus TaxID=2212850 RepID=A0A5N5UGY7_9EURY|nr:quinone-dependent dihydroorotate dehydrogenase [Halosegnis rubeus]KAB7515210.1 quinone-dependent dihydroorotate dehydrogenase [Halosegnis rubeus]KAB7516264.1 quinone-dependent dihydroorotate dehydrogenase [Halosegnis rubeus]KAB7517748.1 quinone-dependent dihydroorotate dehydrogenase [Halosegnis rubeus]